MADNDLRERRIKREVERLAATILINGIVTGILFFLMIFHEFRGELFKLVELATGFSILYLGTLGGIPFSLLFNKRTQALENFLLHRLEERMITSEPVLTIGVDDRTWVLWIMC